MPLQVTEAGAGDVDPVLSVDGVTRIFSNGQGVAEVSFAVAPGEVVGLCGVSGCGKSTLLRLIAGRERPDTGTVTRSCRRLGMVFQDPHLLPWLTAQGNVELVLCREDRPQAYEALRRVGLAGSEDRYPAQLSGGMRQRVGIARALAGHPDLLLMDEPFSSLDYFNRMELMALLRERVLGTGIAVVFVSHDVREVAQMCHRVLILGGMPGRVRDELAPPSRGHERPGAMANLEARILKAIRDDRAYA